MDWHYSDGGRAAAGYKGTTDDCVTRAVAIAADLPYQRVYEAINKLAKTERQGSRKRGRSSEIVPASPLDAHDPPAATLTLGPGLDRGVLLSSTVTSLGSGLATAMSGSGLASKLPTVSA